MISNTAFTFEESEFVERACNGLRASVATPFEVSEIRAQCEAKEALCMACEDGMLVISLEAGSEGLELFVLLAVAFRFGAYERQGAALDAIGRDLGAKTVAFRARRRGWARRLGPEWQRRGSEFVRSIQ